MKNYNCLVSKVERGREPEEARGTGMDVRGDGIFFSTHD